MFKKMVIHQFKFSIFSWPIYLLIVSRHKQFFLGLKKLTSNLHTVKFNLFWCTIILSFKKYMHSYNYHHNQDIEQLHHPQNSHVLLLCSQPILLFLDRSLYHPLVSFSEFFNWSLSHCSENYEEILLSG